MNINNNKDLIIIGHPRSGSFWLQSCMPHFDCREIFNTVNFDVVGRKNKSLSLSAYKNILLDKEAEDKEIDNRIRILESINEPKVTKILTFQFQYAHRTEWNENIFKWVNKQEADIVWIKRKNKLASFRSLLIADALGKYIGPLNATTCTIDIGRLPWLIDSLSYWRDDYIKNKLNKPVELVYYEDLLSDNTLIPKSYMVNQNSGDVEITNWKEIVDNLPTSFKDDIGL